MTLSRNDKIRENRLRRMAIRQDLLVRKRRRRDPRAADYGRYNVIDPHMNAIVDTEGQFGLTLDELEDFLT